MSWHIARVARHDVQVHVGDRLPRGGAGVDADGQAVGAVLRLELAGEFERQGPERRRLVRNQAEQVRLVAARDDEGVALGKREGVEESDNEPVRGLADEVPGGDAPAEGALT